MKIVAILLVVLSVALSASIKSERLAAMSKLTYSSLFAEIQTQITSGGPLTSILDTIEKFDKQIRSEQAEHDAMWAIQQADCEDERNFRAGEITSADQAFKVSSKAYRTCNQSLKSSDVDLAQCQQDTVDTNSARDALVMIRKTENERFVKAHDKNAQAIAILDEAWEFLLEAQDAMSDYSDYLIQVNQHSMSMIKIGHSTRTMSQIAPLISLFAQMAASEQDGFDQSGLDKAHNMIGTIQGNLYENQALLEHNEDMALESFNEVKASLDATIRELDTLTGKLQAHIDDMNSCVLEEDIIRSAAKEKRNRNQEMLDTCNAMCDSFEHEFETATEGRNEERDLLRIIKQMAEKRMVKYRDVQENHTGATGEAVEKFGGLDYEDDEYTATSDEWE